MNARRLCVRRNVFFLVCKFEPFSYVVTTASPSPHGARIRFLIRTEGCVKRITKNFYTIYGNRVCNGKKLFLLIGELKFSLYNATKKKSSTSILMDRKLFEFNFVLYYF